MWLLPEDACHEQLLYEIKELSRFLSELAVCDYFFVCKKPTTVGLAALLTSIELIEGDWKPGVRKQFLSQVVSVAGCDHQSQDVLECKARLRETYIQGGFYDPQQATAKDRAGDNGSPVCVSNAPQS